MFWLILLDLVLYRAEIGSQTIKYSIEVDASGYLNFFPFFPFWFFSLFRCCLKYCRPFFRLLSFFHSKYLIGTIQDLKIALSKLSGIDVSNLVICELFTHKIYQYFEDSKSVENIGDSDVIAAYVKTLVLLMIEDFYFPLYW